MVSAAPLKQRTRHGGWKERWQHQKKHTKYVTVSKWLFFEIHYFEREKGRGADFFKLFSPSLQKVTLHSLTQSVTQQCYVWVIGRK